MELDARIICSYHHDSLRPLYLLDPAGVPPLEDTRHVLMMPLSGKPTGQMRGLE